MYSVEYIRHVKYFDETGVWISSGINLFSDIINPKTVSEPFYFPAVHEKFRCKERFYPQTLQLYILHIYKQPTDLYKQESFSAGAKCRGRLVSTTENISYLLKYK